MPSSRNELQEVSSRALPPLERVPGKQNWVDKTGGLPSYIDRIAKHLHYEKGRTIGAAIATAVETTRRWCSTGRNWNGGNLSAATQAKACKAAAEWEAKKAKSKAKTAAKKLKETAEIVEARELLEAGTQHCDDQVAAEIAQLVGKRLTVAEGMLPLLQETKTVGKAELVQKAQDLLRSELSESVSIGRLGGKAAEPREMKATADALAAEVEELRALGESFGLEISEGAMGAMDKTEQHLQKGSETTPNTAQDAPPWEDETNGGKKKKRKRKTAKEVEAAKAAKTKSAAADSSSKMEPLMGADMEESLKRGSEGELVEAAQEKLVAMGTFIGDAGVDGKFGVNTERAVKAVQRRENIKADGIVGPKTIEILEAAEAPEAPAPAPAPAPTTERPKLGDENRRKGFDLYEAVVASVKASEEAEETTEEEAAEEAPPAEITDEAAETEAVPETTPAEGAPEQPAEEAPEAPAEEAPAEDVQEAITITVGESDDDGETEGHLDEENENESVEGPELDGSPEHESAEGEAAEPSEALVGTLSRVVADAFTLYTTAHGFHWNVRGQDFAQYHELFGEIYDDVWGSIDGWAENIRKLGADAPFRLTELLSLRELSDPEFVVATPADMAAHLLIANEKVLECLNETFAAATAVNQQGIANFAADRIDQHLKWSWQLRSSLQNQDHTV